ncbi:right-handed parallel beta-helix repeat-containing protein [bacterium]|nr:right-handed parallel beta-helix repeat-containing protein [bacterium]
MRNLSKVLVLGFVVLMVGLVEAKDIYVPGSYTTIQAAVNAAITGDTVRVSAGTYREAVSISKGIALVGVGSDSTTITASELGNINTVTFDGIATNNASISGFKITGAPSDYSGIYCTNGNPTITNNTISRNSGKGINCYSSSPSITNNTITGNSSGIDCSFSSSPLITNNIISGNNRYGIYCYSSSPSITNNIISRNSGKGINCDDSSPSITNNIISGNGDDGIYCISSSPNITNNTISGNSDDGICCRYSSSPTITNNTISRNSGKGIYCGDSSPLITNNTITENGITSLYGCGIYVNSGDPSINYNCIWGNGNNNYYDCSAGPNDISANPQFIGGGDYHLRSSSPCIDKGLNTASGIPDKDKDGKPRIANGTVDIGAYEYRKRKIGK